MEMMTPMTHAPRSREHGASLWRAYAFAKLASAGRLRQRAACAPQPLRLQLIEIMMRDVADARWGQRFAREDGWRLP
jgi:hypothetical protein